MTLVHKEVLPLHLVEQGPACGSDEAAAGFVDVGEEFASVGQKGALTDVDEECDLTAETGCLFPSDLDHADRQCVAEFSNLRGRVDAYDQSTSWDIRRGRRTGLLLREGSNDAGRVSNQARLIRIVLEGKPRPDEVT